MVPIIRFSAFDRNSIYAQIKHRSCSRPPLRPLGEFFSAIITQVHLINLVLLGFFADCGLRREPFGNSLGTLSITLSLVWAL